MTIIQFRAFVPILLLGTIVGQSRAGVVATPDLIYETGPYDFGLWPSDFSAPATGGPFGQYADTFTLDHPSIISTITFFGVYSEPEFGVLPVDDFTLRFYATASGVPDVMPSHEIPFLDVMRQTYLPGIPDESAPVYSYTATLTPELLSAGTYGISIVNNLSAVPLTWRVGLSEDFIEQSFARGEDGESWTSVTGELAFSLRGVVVPEPATGVLALIGLLSFCGQRKRSVRRGP